MIIKAINYDIEWKDNTKNFENLEAKLNSEVADLFILPEMFSTGFCMDAEAIADRNFETLRWMQQFAQKKESAICGSASVFGDGHFFNRFYFVKPDGDFEFYDKRHLFSYSKENEIYTAGSQRKIVEYKGVRFLLQICYDLRFPVFSRNENDYDAVIYVANWPKARVEAWKTLLKARAIENLAYVFGVNRIGKDGNNLEYEESTLFFFADGLEISKKEGNIISAEIDLDQLNQFRNQFKFLEDRDSFKIDN